MSKEKLKQIVAGLLIENGKLKMLLRNKAQRGDLTDEEVNEIIDLIGQNNETIDKLREGLK